MITLCGCGALGSRLALELCNLKEEWVLIDDDKVEAANIGTSAFFLQHVGQDKAVALAELMWRKNRVIANPQVKELAQPLDSKGLILDCFDNPYSRLLTISPNTLHVGVGVGEVGSVIWDKDYTKPSLDFERGNNPVCTHELGDLIIRSTVAVAVYSIRQFLGEGVKKSYFLNGCTNIFNLFDRCN